MDPDLDARNPDPDPKSPESQLSEPTCRGSSRNKVPSVLRVPSNEDSKKRIKEILPKLPEG